MLIKKGARAHLGTQTATQRQRLRFGKEEQGSVCSFRRKAGTEQSGLCDDAADAERCFRGTVQAELETLESVHF